jgi:glycosyltransferase involved in cell wall biosynthesis
MVTIIVTTYNRDFYLEKCLKSILAQTFTDINILVISDGYFRNTEVLIESFKDNRIKLLSNIHTGLPAVSRNIGLKYVQTKYVCFCDDDDMWHEDKLALQIEFIEQSKFDVVFTDVSLINSIDLEITNNVSFFMSKYNQLLLNEKNGLFFKNFICLSSSLIKTSVTKKVLFNESLVYRGTEDYLFWLELLISKFKFCFIDNKLVKYRVHDNNLSGNRLNAYIRTLKVFKYLIKKYPSHKTRLLLVYFFYSVKKYFI